MPEETPHEETPAYKLARRDAPDTSHMAAEALAESGNVKALESLVLRTIRNFGLNGCISDEVRRVNSTLHYSSVTGRYAALIEKHLVRTDHRKRIGEKNRKQRVMWAAEHYVGQCATCQEVIPCSCPPISDNQPLPKVTPVMQEEPPKKPLFCPHCERRRYHWVLPGDEWRCIRCGTLNRVTTDPTKKQRLFCPHCECQRDHWVLSEDEWRCIQCGKLNKVVPEALIGGTPLTPETLFEE